MIVTGGRHYSTLKMEAAKLFRANHLPDLVDKIKEQKNSRVTLETVADTRTALKGLMTHLRGKCTYLAAYDDKFLYSAILVVNAKESLNRDQKAQWDQLEEIISEHSLKNSPISDLNLTSKEIQYVKAYKEKDPTLDKECYKPTYIDFTSTELLNEYKRLLPSARDFYAIKP